MNFDEELKVLHEIIKQPQQSGVNLMDYSPLFFKDHIWQEYNKTMGITPGYRFSEDELISLVNVVVKVDDLDVYKLKNKRRSNWETYGSKTTIFEKLFNDYHTFKYESLTDDTLVYTTNVNKISLLVYGKSEKEVSDAEGNKSIVDWRAGSIPSVYQVVNYPMQPDFLVADTGQFVLNEGSTYETIESDADYERGSKILWMIYRNLCNYPPIVDENGEELSEDQEREVLYRKVLTNTYDDDDRDFRFVIHWCAALIQNPGINLMTNIWFAGEYQGIGKGTLVNLLSRILHESRVAKCKANMIDGNFNAALDGKFLLEINEKQPGISQIVMTNWLKGFSQETTLQIEKKGKDPFTRINIINIVGTCQDPADVFKIEDEDRRNVIFRTVELEKDNILKYHRNYAKVIARGLEKDIGWAKAFAFLLERVVVDFELLSTSYQTRGYKEVKSTQIAATNPVYHWALGHLKIYNNNDIKLSNLRDEYMKSNKDISQNYFNKKIRELSGLPEFRKFKVIKPDNIPTMRFDEVDSKGNIEPKRDSIAYWKSKKANTKG